MSIEEPQPTPPRGSILARIVPALSYALPALGAAVSAFLVIQVFRGMRYAETAGIAAVAGGLSEANIAILVTLYLSILAGLAGLVIGIVRAFTTTKTGSPSAWFFLITGALGFVPMLALWSAQSLVLDVIFARSPIEGGVSAVASQISLLLQIAIVSAAFALPMLLVSSLIPLPAILRAQRKWAPAVVLALMEIAIIAVTVLYQWRTSWLYQQVEKY